MKLRHCSLPFSARHTLWIVGALSLVCSAYSQGENRFVGSGTNGFNGTDVNSFTGATRFYTAGYTGSRSVIANIEAGHAWNGHETLGHINTFMGHPNAANQFDRHATWTAFTMVGRPAGAFAGEYQRGISYGATLWSGAVATNWTNGFPNVYSNSFQINANTLVDPYALSMIQGINGVTADVVNSSWGDGSTNGTGTLSRFMDAMILDTKKVVVASAGNSGPGANTVSGFAAGYNSISVGSQGGANFASISSFSSRGPNTYNGPDGTVTGARAKVDIVAPGESLTLAFYGGLGGGNYAGPSVAGNNLYSLGVSGTSFSSPVVAGGAALLVDVAKDKFANNANARDGRVIKALLLNSALKMNGWTNNLSNVGGVLKTSQALDYAQGAGMLMLAGAYEHFTKGTLDMAGTDGGVAEKQGWDFGSMSDSNTENTYFIKDELIQGMRFNATLNWFVDTSADYVSTSNGGTLSTSSDRFADLSLQLWTANQQGQLLNLVAESDAKYLNTEHFSLSLAQTGYYAVKVNYLGVRYNFLGNSNVDYGLAWAAVPEPGTMVVLGLGAAALLRRRRRA